VRGKLISIMFYYPNINPVLLHITDFIQVRWYGLMYVLGFTMAWVLLRYRTYNNPAWQPQNYDMINDLFFYGIIGVLFGGRLGYMLFYDLGGWIASPSSVFAIQNGGMSFHGGFIGVIVALLYFCHKYRFRFLDITDEVAPVVPLGLGAGRIGNFINGELWGCTTQVPWGMVFPHVDAYPRHPAQLYAVVLEGIVLFIILWIYAAKPHKSGQVSGVFLITYALVRILEEFFRQPDAQYGYLAFGWVTMGQILCMPMLVLGCILFFRKQESSLCVNT